MGAFNLQYDVDFQTGAYDQEIKNIDFTVFSPNGEGLGVNP